MNIILTSITGGAAPYTYLWSNGYTGKDLIGVPEGTYSVIVKDSHGCPATQEFILNSCDATVEDVPDITICLVNCDATVEDIPDITICLE